MSASICPYLSFSGNAAEVLEFYASVLGGTPDITTFGSFGYEEAPADAVMHGALETDSGLRIFASDDPEAGSRDGTDPGWITIALFGDDVEQLRAYWDGLTAGGEVTVPFEQAPWGDTYGQFTDRFGVKWMVNASAAS